MSIDNKLIRSRAFFDGGIELSGPEGLEALSVACAMSSERPSEFRASVIATAFGGTMVTRLAGQHLRVARKRSMVDDMYGDYLQLGFVVAGSTFTQQARHDRTTTPGDMTALFNGAPYDARLSYADIVEFYLPVSLLREHQFSAQEMAGQRWAATPSTRALQRFLCSMASNAGSMAGEARLHVGRAITEMGLAILYEQRGGAAPLQDVRAASRIRALSFVAQHFAEPDLDVGRVAAHIGASRRYVQGLFEAQGTSVGRVIREARLRHAALLLAEPGSTSSSIAKIALMSGFRGADQMTRAFKRAHDMTPRDYRARAIDDS